MNETDESADYQIVSGMDAERLSTRVRELLGQGYEPAGGLACTYAGLLMQAMYRRPVLVVNLTEPVTP